MAHITERTQYLITNEKCWVDIEDQTARYTGAWAEAVTINVELDCYGKTVEIGRICSNAIYTNEYDKDMAVGIAEFESDILQHIENALEKQGYYIAETA